MTNRKTALTVVTTIVTTALLTMTLVFYISDRAQQKELEHFQEKLDVAATEIEETATEAFEEEYEIPSKPEDFKFDYNREISVQPGEYALVQETGEIVQVMEATDSYIPQEEVEEGYKVLTVMSYMGSDPEHDPLLLSEQQFDYKSFNLVDIEGNPYPRYEGKELWYIELEPGEIVGTYLHWIVPENVETAYMEYISINDQLLKEMGTTGTDNYSFFIDLNTNYER